MARNYRTSSANPLDYMYSINAPLMEKVLLANDQGITNTRNTIEQARELGAFNYLEQDKDDAIALQREIEAKADELANNMASDPVNWRKHQDPLRRFKRELQENYTSGPISKYQGRYSTIQKAFTEADKQADLWHTSGGKKGRDPQAVKLWKAHELSKVGRGKNEDGTFNNISTNPLYDHIDIPAKLQEAVKNTLKDKTTTAFTKDSGARWDDVKQSWEGYNQDRLLGVLMNTLSSDPMIMKSLSQDADIGYIGGVKYENDIVDKDGNILHRKGDFRLPVKEKFRDRENPFTKEEQLIINKEQRKINDLMKSKPQEAAEMQKELDRQKKEMIDNPEMQWDSGSYLTPILQGVLAQNAGITTENSSKARIDPIYQQDRNIQAGKERINLQGAIALERQRRDFNFKAGEADKTREHQKDLKQMGIDATLRAAALKANGGKGAKGETEKSTTSPKVLGFHHATPFAFLGEDGANIEQNLEKEMAQNRKEVTKLQEERKKFQEAGDIDMANHTTTLINTIKARHFTIANRQNKAREDAENEVNNSLDVRKKERLARASEIEKQYKSYPRNKVPIYLQVEYNEVKKYKDEINEAYKKNLAKASKETTNSTPQIETTIEDDSFLRKSISIDKHSFRVIDPITGKEDVAYSFSNGFDPYDKNLQLVSAGPANGSGAGNIPILVRIKGENGLMVERQIVPVGATARVVEDHFINNWKKAAIKDPSLATVVAPMLSRYYRPVTNLITSINQGNSGIGERGASKLGHITTPQGIVPIQITPSNDGYEVEVELKDGRSVRLKTINGGSVFSNENDIINSLDAAYKEK